MYFLEFGSDFRLFHFFAQKSLRPDQQEYKEDDKRNRILPLAGDLPHAEVLGESQHQGAQGHAGYGSHPPPIITANTPIMSAFMPMVGVMSTSSATRIPDQPKPNRSRRSIKSLYPIRFLKSAPAPDHSPRPAWPCPFGFS